MAKFKIEITETFQKIIEVEAETLSDAIMDIGERYGNAEVFLDVEDFIGFEINEFKEG